MSVRERILALRLLEKQKEKPGLAKQLGIDIKMFEKTKEMKKSVNNGEIINHENKRRFYK